MNTHRNRLAVCCLILVCGLACSVGYAEEGRTPAGLRVFYTGHSFHMFVPMNVERLVAAAGIQGHKLVGRQGIGGSRVIQHWDLEGQKATAKSALKSGQIDVFTMAPHVVMPDEGIANFAKLALEHNPRIRMLVQASWFPFDVADAAKRIKNNADRDQAKIADLQAAVDMWRSKLEAQVDELNREHGKRVMDIVPAGDAVVKLRALVAAGEYPGVARQSELFRDPIGHGGPHVMWLVSYCNFAAIYRTSPEGLKLAIDGIDEGQQGILQQIAWATVSKYHYAGVEQRSVNP